MRSFARTLFAVFAIALGIAPAAGQQFPSGAVQGNGTSSTAAPRATDINSILFQKASTDSCVFRRNSTSVACGSIDLSQSNAVGSSVLAVANGGTNGTSASAARTNLGLAIGSDVQAFSANLGALSGLTSANNKCFYWTGSETAANFDCSSYGRGLINATDASAARTALGAIIGSDVQAYNARLAGISGLASTANRLYGADGSGNAALITMPAAGLSLSGAALSLANDLAALEGLSGTGIARRTGTDAWSVGTTVAVTEGGTGQTSIAQHEILIGSGTNTIAKKSLPDCTDTGGNHLNYTQSTQAFSCGTSASGGGGSLTIDDYVQMMLNSMANAKSIGVAQFYGNRFSDSFGATTYVDTVAATNLDTGTSGLLKPTTTSSSLIGAGLGTNIGNMTGNGGLAAVFDGTTNQAESAGARILSIASGTYVYAGKDYGSGNAKTIGSMQAYPSNDFGYGGGANTLGSPNITIRLYGSNSSPANSTDGTLLGSTTVGDTQTGPQTVTSSDTTTAYRYVWLAMTHDGSTQAMDLAEVRFYTPTVTNNLTVTTTSIAVQAVPSSCVIYARVKHVDSAAVGTDYNFYISRDGGTTFSSAATMTDYFTDPSDSAHVLYSSSVDVSGQPSGSDIRIKVTTSNNKMIETRDWGFRCAA